MSQMPMGVVHPTRPTTHPLSALLAAMGQTEKSEEGNHSMSEAPKLSTAAEAEAAENLTRRPEWAMIRYNITDVTGVVTDITKSQRTTDNGTIIEAFDLHIPQPKNVQAASPITGEAVITIDHPNVGSRLGTRQPYYWTVGAAHILDESVDDIMALKGKEWRFVLSERKPFPTADRASFFYDVKGKGSGTAAAPAATFTRDDLYPIYEAAQGMEYPAATAEFGAAALQRVMLGKDSAGVALGFSLKTVEGKLEAVST